MPASWEILARRRNSILLGVMTPSDSQVSMEYVESFRQLALPPESQVQKIKAFPYGPGRNQSVKLALERGCHLAFLDSDICVESDAYLKLLDTGLDLVSGLYYQRFWPHLPLAFNATKNAKGEIVKTPVTNWKPGDIFPADFLGAGILLIRYEALKRIHAQFPLPFFWGQDIAPVPDYGGQPALPFSEDFTLSYRAKTMGIQGYVHSGVVGLHETKAVVGPRWKLPATSPDPSHGVIANP